MNQETFEMALKNATGLDTQKRKDKKFLWRFCYKTINGDKKSVIFFNFESKGKKHQRTEDYYEVSNRVQMFTFMNTVLGAIDRGYSIVYIGKRGLENNQGRTF